MPVILSNSFKLSMIPKEGDVVKISIDPASISEVRYLILNNEFISIVDSETTAALLTEILDIPIPVNQRLVEKLNRDDILIICQVEQKFPMGKTLKPQEVDNLLAQNKIKFFKVRIK